MTHLLTRLTSRFASWVIHTHDFRGDETVVLRREGLRDVCQYLRDESTTRFDMLIDVTCVDLSQMGQGMLGETFRPIPAVDPSITWTDFTAESESSAQSRNVMGAASPRFEVVYHLYSTHHNHRIRLKVPVAAEDPRVDSVMPIWKGANWFEREVWDFFGITFTGHPHLKRLLLYEGFDGHPLRKDYPVDKRQPLIGPVN